MRSEYSLRSEHLANLELSRVLTRHAVQRVQRKGSVSLSPAVTLCLAAFVGVLLSFAV